MTVTLLLALAAALCTLASALGKASLWVGVLLLCLIQLLVVMPR